MRSSHEGSNKHEDRAGGVWVDAPVRFGLGVRIVKRMAEQLEDGPHTPIQLALRTLRERRAYALALLPFLVDWVENGGWPQRPREFFTELSFGVLILLGVLHFHRLRRQADSLRNLAETDDLTGLGNRARFRFDVERAVGAARRSNESLTLAYIDVDRFKQINDTLGHPIGDEILCGVASALQGSVRQGTDACYRLGGDEFAVLLRNVESDRALEVLRRSFAKAAFSIGMPVSCSVGVVALRSPENAAELLRRADTLMYAAKRCEPEDSTYFGGYFGKVVGGAAVAPERESGVVAVGAGTAGYSPRAALRSASARK